MRIHSLAVLKTALFVLLAATSRGQEYKLTNDSLVQQGVPKGTVTEYTWNTSKVFPGSTRTYWVYVPAQYTPADAACVMVFQDGSYFVDPKGRVQVPTVFDNLIHHGEMPVTIGIFVNPGTKEGEPEQRSIEYDSLGDAYAQFLLEEILAEVGSEYTLTDRAEGRAICGWSSGGLCAFTVAWERPDAFSKVISYCGSFVNLRGAHQYYRLTRDTKGRPKPLRIFLLTGEQDLHIMPVVGKDLSNLPGDWRIGNLKMNAALEFAAYDFQFVMGTGGHDLIHAGSILPDTLRWIWRDYPGVEASGDLSFEEQEVDPAPSLEGKTLITMSDGEKTTWTFREDGALRVLGGENGDGRNGEYAQYGTKVFIFMPGKSTRATYKGNTLELE